MSNDKITFTHLDALTMPMAEEVTKSLANQINLHETLVRYSTGTHNEYTYKATLLTLQNSLEEITELRLKLVTQQKMIGMACTQKFCAQEAIFHDQVSDLTASHFKIMKWSQNYIRALFDRIDTLTGKNKKDKKDVEVK